MSYGADEREVVRLRTIARGRMTKIALQVPKEWWNDPVSDADEPLPFDDIEPVYGEVVADPLEAVRSYTMERHQNIVYLSPIELHRGLFRRIELRVCQVYRHRDGAYRHSRAEILYFVRQRKAEDFRFVRRAFLDGAALETLIAYLTMMPRFKHMVEADKALVVPVGGSITAENAVRLASAIGNLLSSGAGIDAIVGEHLTAEALENLNAATQQARLKRATEELREMIGDPALPESTYQRWFEEHHWIFGTEYVKHIKKRVIDLESSADIILASVDGFVDVFELKKPSERVLDFDHSHRTYYPSAALSKALGQVMHYLRLMNENRHRLSEAFKEPVYRPRAIVVIGRSEGWDAEQNQAWRNIRTTLQNIDILTFDHVLARAEQLIALYEERLTVVPKAGRDEADGLVGGDHEAEPPTDNEDLPF
jgi:hypothetical protein